MAQKAIREFDAKRILNLHLKNYGDKDIVISNKIIEVKPFTDLATLQAKHSWLKTEMLVAKPDQLIKLIINNSSLRTNHQSHGGFDFAGTLGIACRVRDQRQSPFD